MSNDDLVNDLNLTVGELNKLQVLCDFIFFDQYKDMASFPRFEECIGGFFKDKDSEDLNINLEEVYKNLCGKKRKYLTFRRLIKAYLKCKENSDEINEDTKNFFNKLLNETLKNEGDCTGNQFEGAIKYNTKNADKMWAISKLCVVTDEKKENIKGFRIYYDDFFKNDLFLNKSKDKIYISLEINLSVLDESSSNKDFPDINARDGITHLFGTYTENAITFLGFKCRSGKTSFVGTPNGNSFLYGVNKKQLQTIKTEVKDGLLTYILPGFETVDRVNIFVQKDINEINQQFLDDDKPIYEEVKNSMNLFIKEEEEEEDIIMVPLLMERCHLLIWIEMRYLNLLESLEMKMEKKVLEEEEEEVEEEEAEEEEEVEDLEVPWKLRGDMISLKICRIKDLIIF